jgi:prepilin-type N-terminal cleavage/methylation domain-containing protein
MRAFGILRSAPSRPRRCSAFTLVELLVVIGIIALLIGILMPALNRARIQSRTVACASNLHQLGLVFHMYANENKGSVPLYKECGPLQWFLFYRPYLVKDEMLTSPNPGSRNLHRLGELMPVFDCPETENEVFFNLSGADNANNGLQRKTFDYMMVCSYPPKLARMKKDSILMIDHRADLAWFSSVSGGTWPGGFWNIHYLAGSYAPSYAPGYHHNGGANLMFPDASVAYHKRVEYQPYYNTKQQNKFTMKYHLNDPTTDMEE